jgi:hypothetical protein
MLVTARAGTARGGLLMYPPSFEDFAPTTLEAVL